MAAAQSAHTSYCSEHDSRIRCGLCWGIVRRCVSTWTLRHRCAALLAVSASVRLPCLDSEKRIGSALDVDKHPYAIPAPLYLSSFLLFLTPLSLGWGLPSCPSCPASHCFRVSYAVSCEITCRLRRVSGYGCKPKRAVVAVSMPCQNICPLSRRLSLICGFCHFNTTAKQNLHGCPWPTFGHNHQICTSVYASIFAHLPLVPT
jgi:hypothetical protein